MSEHVWTQENLAGYAADGLDAAERDRLEHHLADCSVCRQALEELRVVDRSLTGLFAGVRPGGALEDRLIASLRLAPHGRLVLPRWGRAGLAAAAVLLVAVIGAGVNGMIADGRLALPDPEGNRIKVANNIQQIGLATATDERASSGSQSATPPAPAGRADAPTEVKDADLLAEEVTKAIGYEPPARALVVRGTSRIHTNLGDGGGPPARSPHTPGKPEVTAKDNGRTPEFIYDFSSKIPPGTSVSGVANPSAVPRGLAGTPNGSMGTLADPYLRQRDWANTYKQAESDKKARSEGGEAEKTHTSPYSTYLYLLNSKSGQQQGQTAPAVPSVPTADGTSNSITLGDKSKDTNGPSREWALPGVFQRPTDAPARTPTAPDEAPAKAPAVNTPPPPTTTPAEPIQPAPAPPVVRKIIIRSGDIEFEIESFDSAVATVTRLINPIQGAFVATVNSEKLANGKVKGSVVVRVPPERLDGFVADLRRELARTGELKNQRIGSQDITKQYTDLESRLRAARTMEERLLQIIKSGKGEIKDLLNAERELGVWRTKIEEYEGELRYYQNQVALSTLTITLTEKEIRSPAGVLETEKVQMGVEVEDVEKAQAQALAAVAELKGRITKSELKQLAAGQFNATINFEVPPEAAGPARDRFKQLGTLARLDINRVLEAEGGTGRPLDGKVTRKDAQFFVSLYNLANVTPRETVHLDFAVPDAEAVYQTVLARVPKAAGRVVTSNLNQARDGQSVGTIQFEVKSEQANALAAELKALGEVLRYQVTENPESATVTRSKRGFQVQIFALAAVPPRETTTVQVASRDVPASYRALQEALAKTKGRVLSSQLNEQDRQNVTAQLDFEVRRDDEAAMRAALDAAGDILSRTVTRTPENETAVTGKTRVQVTLLNLARVPPRQSVTLAVEVPSVDTATTTVTSVVTEARGRTVESHVAHERNGRVTAKLVYDVPLSAAPGVIEKIKSTGTVRVQQATQNAQGTEGALAVARLDVTLSNAELLVPSDEGLWSQVRRGLSTSLVGLSWSVTVVIIGVLFVLPWVLVIAAVYRLVLWLRGRVRQAPAGQ